ncbi:hypothetical protein Pfo_028245 [Paulownia fortunei]|nr:hypothetical protein Pfo_028245 [Paulownia fortunei]
MIKTNPLWIWISVAMRRAIFMPELYLYLDLQQVLKTDINLENRMNSILSLRECLASVLRGNANFLSQSQSLASFELGQFDLSRKLPEDHNIPTTAWHGQKSFLVKRLFRWKESQNAYEGT